MITFIMSIVVIYVGLVVLMYLFQRKLMYVPHKHIFPPKHYGLYGFEDVPIESEDGVDLHLWYRPPTGDMPTIVYFHGNKFHLGERAEIFNAFASQGFGVAAVSYRGFGKSEGSPHEQGIYKDARAAIKYVKRKATPYSHMIFYGESLGTGVAVQMATEYMPKTLFLQSPYTSVVNRAAEKYWFVPVRKLIRDHFNSIDKIKKVRCPVIIFHGEKDHIIPIGHGKAMYEAANEPKNAIYFPHVFHTDFDSATIAQHVLELSRTN